MSERGGALREALEAVANPPEEPGDLSETFVPFVAGESVAHALVEHLGLSWEMVVRIREHCGCDLLYLVRAELRPAQCEVCDDADRIATILEAAGV